jgi:hypothetical protein
MKNMKKVMVLLAGVIVSGLLLSVKAGAVIQWNNWSNEDFVIWRNAYMSDREWYYTHFSTGGDPMQKVLGFYEDDEITYQSEIYVLELNGAWCQTWGWDDGTYCSIYLGTDGNSYMQANGNWYMYSEWDNSWVSGGSNPPIARS